MTVGDHTLLKSSSLAKIQIKDRIVIVYKWDEETSKRTIAFFGSAYILRRAIGKGIDFHDLRIKDE